MLRVLVEFVPDFEGGEERELACAEIRGAHGRRLPTIRSSCARGRTRSRTHRLGKQLEISRMSQTVWALINKVSMFGWLAATKKGSPAHDLRIVGDPGSIPKSAAERIRQIADGGGAVWP